MLYFIQCIVLVQHMLLASLNIFFYYHQIIPHTYHITLALLQDAYNHHILQSSYLLYHRINNFIIIYHFKFVMHLQYLHTVSFITCYIILHYLGYFPHLCTYILLYHSLGTFGDVHLSMYLYIYPILHALHCIFYILSMLCRTIKADWI